MTQTLTTTELLARLAADASYFRPELFAVYGVDRSGRPFLGWGMQLGEKEAVFYDPACSATHLSTSADQVLRTHRRTGEAHLVWLND
jgi:hypothetical protein